MQQHSDERLIAYLDGELEAAERQQIEAALKADQALSEQLTLLAQSDDVLRSAYADIVNEPVPARLLAAARGTTGGGTTGDGGSGRPDRDAGLVREAEIVPFRQPARNPVRHPIGRWGVGFAAAAGFFGLVIGGGGAYFAATAMAPSAQAPERQVAAAVNNSWLDNAAGNYKLVVNAGEAMSMDVPAGADPHEALQKISNQKLPNLKPWGLSFRGARLVVVEGRPAAQLVYVTDNKAIGPLTLMISSSKQGELAPTFDHRQDVNLLYWRHQGRAYALVGQTDIGYLWGIANDVAWQLDAI